MPTLSPTPRSVASDWMTPAGRAEVWDEATVEMDRRASPCEADTELPTLLDDGSREGLVAWRSASASRVGQHLAFEQLARSAEGAHDDDVEAVAVHLAADLLALPTELLPSLVSLCEKSLVEGWGARLAVALVRAVGRRDHTLARQLGEGLQRGTAVLRAQGQATSGTLARHERMWERWLVGQRGLDSFSPEVLLRERRRFEHTHAADLAAQDEAARRLGASLPGLGEAAVAMEDTRIPRSQRRTFGALKSALRGVVASLPALASTPAGVAALAAEVCARGQGRGGLLEVALRLGDDQRRRVAAAVLDAVAADGVRALLVDDRERVIALCDGMRAAGGLFGLEPSDEERVGQLLCAVAGGGARAAAEVGSLSTDVGGSGFRALASAWLAAAWMMAGPRDDEEVGLSIPLSPLVRSDDDVAGLLSGLARALLLARSTLAAPTWLALAPRLSRPLHNVGVALEEVSAQLGGPLDEDPARLGTAAAQLLTRLALPGEPFGALLARRAGLGVDPRAGHGTARPEREARGALAAAGLRASAVRELLGAGGPAAVDLLHALADEANVPEGLLLARLAALKDRQVRRLAVYVQQGAEDGRAGRGPAWLAEMVARDPQLSSLVAQ